MEATKEVVLIVEPLLWWALVFGAVLYGLRQLRRYLDGRLELQRQEFVANEAEKAVAVAERQQALKRAQDTHDETVGYERAALRLRAAKAADAEALLRALTEERIAAELRVLEARTKAEEEQAAEHVRAEHAQARERDGVSEKEDVIERYHRYRRTFAGSAQSPNSFEAWLETMRQHGQL
ncbi:MAG TPA: hypothetical protein VLA88_05715 [Candidatus Saccharimonadales bacterium]|nr:hypothetical protein [Candidatus Saccharimonadales bacterium]